MWHSKNFHLYIIIVTVNFGALIDGTFLSWTSPIIVKLNKLDDNPLGRRLTETEEGLLSCIGVIGCSLGCYLSGYIAKKYGRKKALIIFTIPSIIGCILLISPNNVFWLIFARCVWGMTNGSNFTIIPMYVGEVANSEIRGRMSSVMSIFLYAGFLFSMSVGPYTPFWLFHVLLALIPSVYIILLITVVSESPYYLAETNLNEAENVLKKLRGRNDVKEELGTIMKYNNNKVQGTLSDILKDKGLKKALVMGCGLIFFQQCSGISVILSYGQKIFEEVDFIPSAWSTIIVAFMQVIFGFATPIFIDRTGRKKLLIFSEIGIIISLLIFGVYFYMKTASISMSNFNWLPLFAIIMYKFMYALGMGPVPWILVGAIFPPEMKGAACATVTAVCSWTTFFLCLSFNWMKDLIGIYGVFWSFSLIVLLATIFSLKTVFETKGKSLLEIQEIIIK